MKYLFYCTVFTLISVSAIAKTVGFPQEDISKVIEKARSYVRDKKLDVTDSFIQKAEFKNQYDEYHSQFWEITFVKVPSVKGGYLIIRVYNDGKIDHSFGE